MTIVNIIIRSTSVMSQRDDVTPSDISLLIVVGWGVRRVAYMYICTAMDRIVNIYLRIAQTDSGRQAINAFIVRREGKEFTSINGYWHKKKGLHFRSLVQYRITKRSLHLACLCQTHRAISYNSCQTTEIGTKIQQNYHCLWKYIKNFYIASMTFYVQ